MKNLFQTILMLFAFTTLKAQDPVKGSDNILEAVRNGLNAIPGLRVNGVSGNLKHTVSITPAGASFGVSGRFSIQSLQVTMHDGKTFSYAYNGKDGFVCNDLPETSMRRIEATAVGVLFSSGTALGTDLVMVSPDKNIAFNFENRIDYGKIRAESLKLYGSGKDKDGNPSFLGQAKDRQNILAMQPYVSVIVSGLSPNSYNGYRRAVERVRNSYLEWKQPGAARPNAGSSAGGGNNGSSAPKTEKTTTPVKPGSSSSQRDPGSVIASNDIYAKAEKAGQALQQMEWQQQAYKRQQSEKWKNAINPGKYYLETSGAWDGYNQALSSIEQEERTRQERSDRLWQQQERQERIARKQEQQEEERRKAIYKRWYDALRGLPDQGLPFYGLTVDQNKLYYFFYYYVINSGEITDVLFSGVFTIGQYPDGSWPDPQKTKEEIYAVYKDPRSYVNLKHDIAGYYLTEKEASQALQHLKNSLSGLQLSPKSLEYNGANAGIVMGRNEMTRPSNQLFAKARDFYRQKQYGEALDFYEQGLKANNGALNPGLFMNTDRESIGYICFNQKNYDQARSWLEKGAENGSVYSLRTLAKMYFSGTGVAADADKAAGLLSGAAALGDLPSEKELALYYFRSGQSVMAAKFMKQAAENGHQPQEVRDRFKLMLARSYAYGENGFPQDINKSYSFYRDLLNRKVPEAQYEFAMVNLDVPFGYALTGALENVIANPEQPAEKRNQARLALVDAVLSGNKRIRASVDDAIGHCLALKEAGLNIDNKLGLCYLKTNKRQQAFAVHQDGIYSGLYYYTGSETSQDYQKAVTLWTGLAADQPAANLLLAVSHYAGKGNPRDPELAKKLFEKACGPDETKNEFLEYYQSGFRNFLHHFPEFMKDHDAFLSFLQSEKLFVDHLTETEYRVPLKLYTVQNERFIEGLAVVYEKGKDPLTAKKGFAGINGNIEIPVIYEAALPFNHGRAMVKYNQKWGLIDKDGTVVIPFEYDRISRLKNGIYKASQDQQVWVFDREGVRLNERAYQYVGNLSEGVYTVKVNNKWGIVNEAFQEVIPPNLEYTFINDFSDGLAAFSSKSHSGFINQRGEELVSFPAEAGMRVGSFSDGKAVIRYADQQYAVLDRTGRETMPKKKKISEIRSFSGNLAPFITKNKLGFVDSAGNEIVKEQYSPLMNSGDYFPMGRFRVRLYPYYGLIDNSGKLIIPADKEDIQVFGDNYRIRSNGLWYISDNNGAPLNDQRFTEIGGLQEGLAIISSSLPGEKNPKLGYMEETGKVVITAQYDIAFPFYDGKAVVQQDGSWFYIDKKGNKISP